MMIKNSIMAIFPINTWCERLAAEFVMYTVQVLLKLKYNMQIKK